MAEMFCIWCGSPAHGDVVIRCQACGRVHYLHSKITGGTLIVVDDRYLAVKRALPPEVGKWDLPGGFSQFGENPAATALRETAEEIGIKVKLERLLGVFMDGYVESDGVSWPTANLIYAATPQDPSQKVIVDGHEIADVGWHPLDCPPPDLAFPTQVHAAIAAYLEPAKTTVPTPPSINA